MKELKFTCLNADCPERTGGECTPIPEMRVLFLDIDGVLNCKTTTAIGNDFYAIDPYKALLITRIKEKTGIHIVLSSSWRNHEKGREIVKKFIDFIDVTPDLGGIRGGEIKRWLDEHPWVKKYAIVDDDRDMLHEQLPNFFRTTWEDGLTDEIAAAIEKHFIEHDCEDAPNLIGGYEIGRILKCRNRCPKCAIEEKSF